MHNQSVIEPAPEAVLDPITFEVIRHRLWAINDEQAMIAARMSGSPVVYEVYDFNTGILTADGHGLVAGVYIMHHAATIDYFVQRILREWPREDIHEGDMFFTNDPWQGALHSNDGILVTPVFWNGEIVCWSGIAMHDEDVGSPVPGSFVVGAHNRFDEAALYPMVKLVERFRINPSIEAIMLNNSRTVENNALNLRARVSSLTVTHRRIHELIGEYGIDVFSACLGETVDYVERVVRSRLQELPDGTWSNQVYLDHNGNTNVLHPIRVALTKRGGSLTVDFEGTSEQADGAINCARAALEGAVVGVFLLFLCYDLPWSVGAAHRVIEFVSKEGTVNNAVRPAATSMASISATIATQQAVQIAFGKMLLTSEEHGSEVQAAWSSLPNCLILSGEDARGQSFTTVDMNNCAGGAGARTFADGLDTGGIFHSMGATIPNVETMESRMPVLVLYRRQSPDSGGGGRFRGGTGIEMALKPHRTEAPIIDICIASSVSQPSNLGISGGLPSPVNYNVIVRDSGTAEAFAAGRIPMGPEEFSGTREVLEAKAHTALHGDDVHLYLQTGGGGYGDPLRRDASAVVLDVRRGLVSADEAWDVYGVLVVGGAADEDATAARRRELREERLAEARPVSSWSGRIVDSGTRAFPVADAAEAVEADGTLAVRCLECHAELGGAGSDLRASMLVRDRPLARLSRLNASAPDVGVVGREYYCPGCGTLMSTDVQRADEPLLADTVFEAAS